MPDHGEQRAMAGSRCGWIVLAIALAATLGACASPTTPPLTPEQIPAAFIHLTQAPDRTMHMVWSGTSAMEGRDVATMPFSGTFDFAGDDYAGAMTTQVGFDPDGQTGKSLEAEIAFVGGQAYRRSPVEGSATWERVDPPSGSLDPLRGLTEASIEYAGQESVAGANLHHVRVRDIASLLTTLFAGLSGGLLGGTVSFNEASSTFDIYVDEEARPVSAQLNLATGPGPTDFGTISLSSSYQFSNWGAEIYIVAPP